MIKYNPNHWFTLIFHRDSRKTFKKSIPNVISITLYSTLFAFIYDHYLKSFYDVSPAVHSLLGIVLGLFLVFRTNTAYDKWWEGRKIWGALVNDSRNLALKLNAFLPGESKEERKLLSGLISNFAVTLKDHLRDQATSETVDFENDSFSDSAKWEHKPNYIASRIYIMVESLYKKKALDGHQLYLIDKEIKGLTDHVGACERIKNTPIPFSYSMYIKKFIFLYAITLPFGLVSSFKYYTVPVVLFIFYFLLTIELIAEEIEEPFGYDENDLPTDELSEKIGQNVREILMNE